MTEAPHLVHRRVRIGNALGRVEGTYREPGRWVFRRYQPATVWFKVRMDNGMLVHTTRDRLEVLA